MIMASHVPQLIRPIMTLVIRSPHKQPLPGLSRVSDSPEKEKSIPWSSNSENHPPWLRFHLGISRWQLYPHRDPNMEPLIQQLATHRIVSAGVQADGYCVLLLCLPLDMQEINPSFSLKLTWNESVKL